MTTPLIIGSRGSDLALWQSRHIAERLGVPTEIKIIHTSGDRILDRDLNTATGKGFFTKELEDALYARDIDIAVHSLKDLPTQTPPGLTIAAVTERAPVADLLLVHPDWHEPARLFPVRPGGKIGASSLRRQAFVRVFTDGEPASLRGNVPTRVRKLLAGEYAAIVLAEAGLSRLSLNVDPLLVYRLDPNHWLPAPGQGALGVETRAGGRAEEIVRALDDAPTREAVTMERALLRRFEGGCHLPLGTLAVASGDAFRFTAAFAPEPARVVHRVFEHVGPEEGVERAFTLLNEDAREGAGVSRDEVPLIAARVDW